MEKIAPKKIVADIINAAFNRVSLPNSNNPQTQKMLCDLYIANAMASMGNARKKEITDEFKNTYDNALSKAIPNQSFTLESVAPFELNVKVSNPRQSFDKDAFIKKVAEEYDLSISDLVALSKTTVKASAAPVSFDVVLKGEEDDETS